MEARTKVQGWALLLAFAWASQAWGVAPAPAVAPTVPTQEKSTAKEPAKGAPTQADPSEPDEMTAEDLKENAATTSTKSEPSQPASAGTPSGATPAEASGKAAPDPVPVLLQRIEKALTAANPTQIQTEPARWLEFEKFHHDLWRALALDPIQGLSADETLSQRQTEALEAHLAMLISSPAVSRLDAKREFTEYASKCQEILELRKHRFYRDARKYARSGGLDKLYQAVLEQVLRSTSKEGGVRLIVSLPADLDSSLRDSILQLKGATEHFQRPATSGGEPRVEAKFERSPAGPVYTAAQKRSLHIVHILWGFAAFCAFFVGKLLGSGPSSNARPGSPKGKTDAARLRARALELRRDAEASDQRLLQRINGFSWGFSQFFVQYHIEEPTMDVGKFRTELQKQSEALKELTAVVQECVALNERQGRTLMDEFGSTNIAA